MMLRIDPLRRHVLYQGKRSMCSSYCDATLLIRSRWVGLENRRALKNTVEGGI